MSTKETRLALQEAVGYTFRDHRLLDLALTHKSCGHSAATNNERLEFLGDAVLQIVVSDYLFRRYPTFREGRLAKIRSLLVSQPTLADTARTLGIDQWLKVGRGEERTGARNRDSLLCDAVEAVIGAMYLDSDLETVRPLILRMLPSWKEQEVSLVDSKSLLQEHFQQLAQDIPEYALVGESGPPHNRVFEVQVLFHGDILGRGHGKSKKEATQNAAKQALENLNLTD